MAEKDKPTPPKSPPEGDGFIRDIHDSVPQKVADHMAPEKPPPAPPPKKDE